jgi:phage terminase small subunit
MGTGRQARPVRELTDRQRLFVAEYLVDRNATAAAIRAGYSPKRAGSAGHRLKNLPRVREAIAAAQAERLRQVGLSRERVLEELARIAFADIRDFLTWDADGVRLRPMDALTGEQAACVAEIVESGGKTGKGLRVKLHGKLAALAALARLLGVEARREDERPRQLIVMTAVPEPDPPPATDDPETSDRGPVRNWLPETDPRPS